MIFVGDDWAEDHHDIEIQDETGKAVARRRLPEGLEGVARLHDLVAEHSHTPGEVAIGIETDRGLWVASLVDAGYVVYAVNPKAVDRYRDRHTQSGGKSDPGDARVLADLVRTDRHNHRPVAGDSERADAVKLLARAHQQLIWSRRRQANALRAILREFYPAALEAFGPDLTGRDALAVLAKAPTPAAGRALTVGQLTAVLRRSGRVRYHQHRAGQIQAALRSPQLAAPELIADAYGTHVAALVGVIAALNTQIDTVAAKLAVTFNDHPQANVIRSLPGLANVLGPRLLGEFGDDPNRFASARARRSYGGMAPITRASGKRTVVTARIVRNRHLADALFLWAFAAISASPGARAYYDRRRTHGDTHNQALRSLANRFVGVLHGCLASGELYDEHLAWAAALPATA